MAKLFRLCILLSKALRGRKGGNRILTSRVNTFNTGMLSSRPRIMFCRFVGFQQICANSDMLMLRKTKWQFSFCTHAKNITKDTNSACDKDGITDLSHSESHSENQQDQQAGISLQFVQIFFLTCNTHLIGGNVSRPNVSNVSQGVGAHSELNNMQEVFRLLRAQRANEVTQIYICCI